MVSSWMQRQHHYAYRVLIFIVITFVSSRIWIVTKQRFIGDSFFASSSSTKEKEGEAPAEVVAGAVNHSTIDGNNDDENNISVRSPLRRSANTPSSSPSDAPSTSAPTSGSPSSAPSGSPSSAPSSAPSAAPSGTPTSSPSSQPTSHNSEDSTAATMFSDGIQDAIDELPAWMQSYMKWHEKNRNEFIISQQHTTRFLVVLCQDGTRCGGLTDRLRSVLYWLREAEQTNRVLLIHWTKKFPLESFWVPPKGGLNWSLPSLPQLQPVEEQQEEAALSNMRNSSTALNLFGPSSCIYQEEKVLKVSTFPDEAERQDVFQTLQDDTKQLVCVQTQADLNQIVMDKDYYFSDDSSSNRAKTRGRRRRRNLSGDDDHDRTFGRVYQIMFTPSLPLQGYIDNIMVNELGLSSSPTRSSSLPVQVQEDYLAAHIRSEYPLRGGNGGGLTRPNLNDVYPELVQQWAKNAVQQVISTYCDSKKRKRHEGGGGGGSIDDDNNNSMIPPVYVTADNGAVVKYLKSTTNLWTTINTTNNTNIVVNVTILGLESMSRPNIEFTGTTNPADVYSAFFDLYMFSHSKCVSYGLGGYGLFGARLSGTGCMVQHRSSNNLRDYPV